MPHRRKLSATRTGAASVRFSAANGSDATARVLVFRGTVASPQQLTAVNSLAFLVDSPLLALVPAAVLFLFAARARHRLVTVAATAWLLYAIYEWLMLHRVLCSGECNIRIDLLVLHPALIGVTITALVAGLARRHR
jgi:hypothetical protein